LFHDAIYVAGARDNEALSAELATKTLARSIERGRGGRERVARMIEATSTIASTPTHPRTWGRRSTST
jgi:predicted metal-dependent HD superfamily phosphohydrolase